MNTSSNARVLTRIQDVYPRYSNRLLDVVLDDYLAEAINYLERTGRAHFNLANSVTIDPIPSQELERIRDSKVFCMSLYFKAASFNRRENQPTLNEHGQIPMTEIEMLGHPSMAGTPRYEHTFLENYLNKILESDFRDWLPVVYLAQDLAVLEPILQKRGFIVIKVRHSSIAECPGAMWRFLGFNLDCQCCYIQDTDRTFNYDRVEKYWEIMRSNPQAALLRPLQWTSPGGEMALILGNDFLVRPINVDFQAHRMMLGYIILNILHEDRLNNFSHEHTRNRDDFNVEPMSKRLKRGHVGPMPHERVGHKCYPYYPFDEQWLKEFVYYHFSDGRMITLLRNEKPGDLFQQLDLQFQKTHNNFIIPF